MIPNACEYIEDLAILGADITDTVSGENGKIQISGDSDCGLIAFFLPRVEVALQFNVDIFRSK